MSFCYFRNIIRLPLSDVSFSKGVVFVMLELTLWYISLLEVPVWVCYQSFSFSLVCTLLPGVIPLHLFIHSHSSLFGEDQDRIPRETAEIEPNSLAVWLMLFSSSCNLLSVRIKDEFLIVSTMAFSYSVFAPTRVD